MARLTNAIYLPTRRPFSWRALWILAALQLLGNLLSIPSLIASNLPIDPLPYWLLWTGLSIPVIGFALFLGAKIGLGAPLLEGCLIKENRYRWVRSSFAVSILVAVAATPLIILLNQDVDPQGYPAPWKLVLASVDAGVQEELFSRLFLVNILAWLGGLVWHEQDGRPTQAILWSAILLSALVFGWGHIDDKLTIPGAAWDDLATLMAVSTLYGVIFGVLYWRLGIECALLAHFTLDAFASGVIVPVYISENLLMQVFLLVGLLGLGTAAWFVLKGSRWNTNPGE